jgi:hypothetical protein
MFPSGIGQVQEDVSIAHGDDQAHVETTGKPSPDLGKHNGLKQALLATTLRDATLV